MAGHRRDEAFRALLFERLVDLEPRNGGEARPFRTHDADGLRESVRREVERLLNTRCSIPAHQLQDEEPSVINFGIPDLTAFFGRRSTDRDRLCSILSRTIAAFEPRLGQVRTTIEGQEDRERSLVVRVDAVLVVDSVREPISFPVVILGSALVS